MNMQPTPKEDGIDIIYESDQRGTPPAVTESKLAITIELAEQKSTI